jgi:hypothetical protein
MILFNSEKQCIYMYRGGGVWGRMRRRRGVVMTNTEIFHILI